MAKKVAKPSKIKKSEAEKLLGQAPEEFVFWCNNGRVLRNMKELAEALDSMSDETYAYHSNEVKKDFSTWVRDIIKDEALAKELEKPINRAEAAKVVAARVDLLSSVR